tara:strand:+ start:44959 stop:45792 length:834 start_codon:yes stop_codon:yes gene_type:complete
MMFNTVLGIEIALDPNIVKIGDVLITWHGLFTAMGIFVGLNVILRLARLRSLDEDNIYTLALVAIPSGIVGARGLFVIEHWSYFSGSPLDIIRVNEGGISVWGALLTGVIVTVCFAKWRNYPLRVLLDICGLGMILGLAIGRVGDLINGEHLAKATDLPWGVLYTDPDSPAFAHSLAFGSHHPATTYEMLSLLSMFFVLLPLFLRFLNRWSGVTFSFVAIGYAVTRFFLTEIRLDSPEVFNGFVAPQIISGVIIIIVVPLMLLWVKDTDSSRGITQS